MKITGTNVAGRNENDGEGASLGGGGGSAASGEACRFRPRL